MEMPRGVGTGLPQPAQQPAKPLLEHEGRLVAGAVALVASGGAPRVWLVGMRSGRELVRLAITMGNSADLLVRAKWWPNEEALDLVVQQHG